MNAKQEIVLIYEIMKKLKLKQAMCTLFSYQKSERDWEKERVKASQVDEEIFKAGEGGGEKFVKGGMCACARRYERIRLPDSKI